MRLTLVLLLALAACGGTPKKKDMSYSAKISRAQSTDDQAELARLARDRIDRIRLAAVTRLDDQEVLAERVEKDTNREVRWAALKRLHDQAALERIATQHPEGHFRVEAIRRMTDEAALVRIATTHKDRVLRSRAAARLTSEAGLLQVVNSKGSLAVQVGHVGLLVHAPAFQRRFPGASIQVSVTQTEAIIVLHDGKTLGRTAWWPPLRDRTPSKTLIRTLVAKLTDADCRELVSSPSEFIRNATAVRGAGPEELAALAVSSPSPATRANAVARSTDQALKARVARTDPSDQVRLAAVKTLTDQEALNEVASDPEETAKIRAAAKARLKP